MAGNHKFIGFFKRFSQSLENRVNNNLLTYVVFLLIAIVIWYFNALNKDYTTDLKFRLKYVDMPEDKVPVNTPPDRLTLVVHAQGFTLLKYRLGLTFYPIVLDVGYQTLRRNHTAPEGEYYITTLSVFDKIEGQLSADVTLRSVSPDTLKFFFSETVQKNIPVKVLAKLQLDKEFLPVGAMRVNPTSVRVTGPQAIVDTMQFVYTRSENFKRLKDTLRAEIRLQPVNRVRYSADEVKIEQAIERHTEATVIVPVEAANLPEGMVMKTFPGTVTVNCMVPLASFEKLQPGTFRVVADYSAISELKDNNLKLRLSLVKSPDYVSDVRFHPKSVDFVIEK
jgi:YbbR domain-containing protein